MRCLKESTLVFEDSIDALSYGLVFFNIDEKFCMANKCACRYLPFISEDTAMSDNSFKTLNDFFGYMFDHAVECDKGLKRILDKSFGHMGEEGFREVIECSNGMLCLADVRKTIVGRKVIILRDLSEFKKDEDNFIQLHQHNFELTEAVEAATNGILIAIGEEKLGYRIAFVNNAFCEHAFLLKKEIVGSDVQELLYGFVGDNNKALVIDSFENVKSVDFEIQTEYEQKKRWFNFKLTPVINNIGYPGLFIGVSTETTELKLREAEFFQAQKLDALGKLAAGVAHDFNNVLSIIDGYSHIAINLLEDGDTTKDYLEKIRTASARGAALTQKMLTFSRHKIVVENVIDLSSTISMQEILLQPLIDASVNMSFYTYDKDLFVECTADSIIQVVMNLVVNARDAMPDGGDLQVEARKVERCAVSSEVQKEMCDDVFVCLSISDTGHGIKNATLERMFDPFFTTKDQGKGAGLGLSMVYGLVKQMGGCIDVKTKLNQGTTFFVYLPVSDKKPQKVIAGNVQDISSLSLKGYTVLVVEDEPELLDIVANLLEKLDMNVLTASNGNEALLKQDNYTGDIDLLLTDVVMPELDGIKLAELLTSLRTETKTIFMSGYPADGRLACIDLPEKALFVAKPINYESLARIVFKTVSDTMELQNGDLFETTPHWESSDIIQESSEV